MSKQYQNECLNSIFAFNDMQKAAIAKINAVLDQNPMLKSAIFESALHDLEQGINGVEYHQEQLKASINQQELKRA